jgi:Arc/MetJ family transcription regulator
MLAFTGSMARTSRWLKVHHKCALKQSATQAALNDGIIDAATGCCWTMRTTITIDDDLIAKAQKYTGIQEKSALIRAALEALVQREAARRLARLGGSQPDLKPVRRRRSKVA